ncbi:DnaJ C-terminal domain-containing protein [Staphylococcus aureus]
MVINIYYKLNVSFPQAALGDEAKIPTLNNEVMLTIPAGTQTGKQLLKRKGYKKCSWAYGYGDLYVDIKVVTPTKLTYIQKN